jgi:adenosine kinase
LTSARNPVDVACVGHAFVDVVGRAGRDFLARHGIPLDGGRKAPPDLLRRIAAELPDATPMPGGSSANTAATIAALGGKARFHGRVGDDPEGRLFMDDFAARGVGFVSRRDAGSATGKCLVLLTDECRSFASDKGCAAALDDEDFANPDFASAGLVLTEGDLVEGDPETSAVAKAISSLRGRVPVAVNLQGFNTSKLKETIARFAAVHADIVAGNRSETEPYMALVGSLGLRRKTLQTVVTTLGADGATATNGAETWRVPATAPRIFASSVGAGDGFLAGLLLPLSRGEPMPKAMVLGSATAAAVIEEYGPRPSHGRSLAGLLRVRPMTGAASS